MNGLDVYYYPMPSVEKCWNETIEVNMYKELPYEEYVTFLSKVFAGFLKVSKIERSSDWVREYVIDNIQKD